MRLSTRSGRWSGERFGRGDWRSYARVSIGRHDPSRSIRVDSSRSSARRRAFLPFLYRAMQWHQYRHVATRPWESVDELTNSDSELEWLAYIRILGRSDT